jgi:hypothetical protein
MNQPVTRAGQRRLKAIVTMSRDEPALQSGKTRLAHFKAS